jgi:hypothetical protein
MLTFPLCQVCIKLIIEGVVVDSEIVGEFSKDYGFSGAGRKACELAPHTGAVASSDDAK